MRQSRTLEVVRSSGLAFWCAGSLKRGRIEILLTPPMDELEADDCNSKIVYSPGREGLSGRS